MADQPRRRSRLWPASAGAERSLHPVGPPRRPDHGSARELGAAGGLRPAMVTAAVQRDRSVADWIDSSGRFTLNQFGVAART